MKNLLNIFILAITCFVLTSCATLISGPNQNIFIKAVDSDTKEMLTNVVCNITTSKGAGYNISLDTNAFISIDKDQGILEFKCAKTDYKQISVTSTQSFDGAIIGNLLFWPGFIVDASTGSMKKYPSHIIISMKKI
ncbi:MAG: hypothetical protein H6909_00265 [Rickettsiaceae bacterium]|nr:hypothetical protein [Rickettsiaceae bacterium]